MDYSYTVDSLPVFGAALILIVLFLSARSELFSGAGSRLPRGGWRYYIGAQTVLYIVPRGSRYRVYLLEGEPPDIRVGQSRAGLYFDVTASCAVEAEREIDRLYQR